MRFIEHVCFSRALKKQRKQVIQGDQELWTFSQETRTSAKCLEFSRRD